MTLVKNNQIKLSNTESPFFTINKVKHSGIGRQDYSRIEISVFALGFRNRANRGIRKMLFECVFSLIYKFGSVCKEKNMFCPICPLQNVYNGDGTTCFSCSRCHNDQGFALFFIKRIANSGSGFLNKRSV